MSSNHLMRTSQFSPDTGVHSAQCTLIPLCSLVCPVYTKQLLAALFHYKHSTSENQRNLISLLEAILQIITNLYSKIPNISHHDLELQVFLSAD